MLADLHFLRPWWLLALLPLLVLTAKLWRSNARLDAWASVCDSHLLSHLVLSKGESKRHMAVIFLFLSALCLLIGLTGPCWEKLPVPSYHRIEPRILVLDMSDSMLERDLSPDRLTRAKFKLHDLFSRSGLGQTGLVVYTGEPFIVSPLTEDAKTIDALLSSLTPDIMPVGGQKLDTALQQAGKLITQAGFNQGQILVLTAESPSSEAIHEAETLAKQGIMTSVMPVVGSNQPINPLFQALVKAGDGLLIPYTNNASDLNPWLNASSGRQHYNLDEQNLIPVWRDEGRWFLIPALLFLLPVFRRGWLQRIET